MATKKIPTTQIALTDQRPPIGFLSRLDMLVARIGAASSQATVLGSVLGPEHKNATRAVGGLIDRLVDTEKLARGLRVELAKDIRPRGPDVMVEHRGGTVTAMELVRRTKSQVVLVYKDDAHLREHTFSVGTGEPYPRARWGASRCITTEGLEVVRKFTEGENDVSRAIKAIKQAEKEAS